MTGAGKPNSNYAGTLNLHIYNAVRCKSATEWVLLLLQRGHLGYSLIAETDTLYSGIGLVRIARKKLTPMGLLIPLFVSRSVLKR